MSIHRRRLRRFGTARFLSEIRGFLHSWLVVERHFRQKLAILVKSLRTSEGRERLWQGVYGRIPSILWALAKIHRQSFAKHVRVVAIIGSYGKTTTTRAVAAALGVGNLRSIGQNYGSALSAAILRMRYRDRHAVLEVAMGGKGQIEKYARLIQPDIVVVTCIGTEHMTSTGSLEATRAEKAKMVAAVPSSGVVVLNGDDPHVLWMKTVTRAQVITYGFNDLNQIKATDVVENDINGLRFALQLMDESYSVDTRLIGRHMIHSILAAMAVTHSEGQDPGQTIASLEQLEPTYNRLQVIQLKHHDAWILLDAKKSGLETIEAALHTLSKLPANRKLAILGDIEEPPGSQGPIYKLLGKRLAEVADYVIFIGGKKAFNSLRAGAVNAGLSRDSLKFSRTSPQQITAELDELLKPGDLVLLKGRTNQHLERVALLLKGESVICSTPFCLRRHDCASCLLRMHPS